MMPPARRLNLLAALLVPLVGLGGFALVRSASHDHHADDHTHAAPWVAPGPYPDRIALTWAQDPATSLSITWRTDTTVAGARAEIALATPAPRFDATATTHGARTEVLDAGAATGEHLLAAYHSVTFDGLMPDTLYAYRVGDGTRWSEWFHARTASQEAEPFSFIYFGDAQNGLQSHWSRAIRAAFAQAPDARFVVHAGDLVNIAHRNFEWGEWFYAGSFIHGMIPIVPVPGNHEYGRMAEGEDRQLSVHWRPQFTLPENGIEGLPETSYYLDVQGVRIVALDSNRDLEGQARWLEDVLQDNPNPWTVAVFHHPIYSSGGTRDNPELRRLWKPLFDRYGVDLALQGHDHTYARGRATNAGGGVNRRDAESGTVYVNSVSGAKMYAVKDGRWSDYGATMERAAENTQLFQVIEVDGDRLRFRAYTVTGTLYDAFDLVKQPTGPNRFVAHPVAGTPERTHENTIPYTR